MLRFAENILLGFAVLFTAVACGAVAVVLLMLLVSMGFGMVLAIVGVAAIAYCVGDIIRLGGV